MLNVILKRGALALSALMLWAASPLAAAAQTVPDVVATVRPLHSLAAQVMGGLGEPDLLLESAASPHSYAMRPSNAMAISRADLLIWAGPAMETFLERTVTGLPEETRLLTVSGIPTVRLLPTRPGNPDGDTDHSAHDGGLPDAHVWLDPDNAIEILKAIARTLGDADPRNAEIYRANAEKAMQRIEDLREEIAGDLSPLADRPYIAAHDAYQYFERAFGLGYGGAVTAHPGRPPSAKHILEITGRIRESDIGCLLTEPGNTPPLIVRLADESGMNLAEADPLGLNLTPGPDLYDRMMRNLAEVFARCLGD